MSLNFYKSKIFIALTVCLGSIGISQSNVYAQQSDGQGNFDPVTGEAEVDQGIENGTLLGQLIDAFGGPDGLRAQLMIWGVRPENIEGFQAIAKFLENKDIRRLSAFRNFSPTTASALMGAFNSPGLADQLMEEHNKLFAAAYGPDWTNLTYQPLDGSDNSLSVDYDVNADGVKQVTAVVDGIKQIFAGGNLAMSFGIGVALAKGDNEVLRKFGIQPWQTPAGTVELSTPKIPSGGGCVPEYPILHPGSNGQKGDWVTFSGNPRLPQMQDSLLATGSGRPIATIGATDFNRMGATLRSAVVPYAPAARGLLAPWVDMNPDLPPGGVLLAPEVDMNRERLDWDYAQDALNTGTAGKSPQNEFDGDSTNDLK
jgi:hypothetical protein